MAELQAATTATSTTSSSTNHPKSSPLRFLFLLLTLLLLVGEAFSEGDKDGTYDYIQETLRSGGRKTRSVLPSGESCLYIYSVPKQQVRCQPSQETEHAVEEIWRSIRNHTDYFNLLERRIRESAGSEDSARALVELRAKLDEQGNDVAFVKLEQSEQGDLAKELKRDINSLTARLQEIQEEDRSEITRLISLQSDLLKVALHHQNTSLHDNYKELVERTKRDLEILIQQMDSDFQSSIKIMSEKMESNTLKVQLEHKTELDELGSRLQHSMDSVEETMMTATRERGSIRDDLGEKERNLMELVEKTNSLKSKQSLLDEEVYKQKDDIGSLRHTVSEQTLSTDTMEGQIKLLQTSMSEVSSCCQDHTQTISSITQQLSEEKEKSAVLAKKVEEMYMMLTNNGQIIPLEPKLTDCTDALKHYQPISGVYTISPDAKYKPFEAYCHMDSAGGWTVISRREGGFVDFYRGWAEYRAGFGHPNGEHWLGLEKIHYLTYKKKIQTASGNNGLGR